MSKWRWTNISDTWTLYNGNKIRSRIFCMLAARVVILYFSDPYHTVTYSIEFGELEEAKADIEKLMEEFCG